MLVGEKNNSNVYKCYDKAIARVHSSHLNECGPAPGGRQLIGQAANLTFESASRLSILCRLWIINGHLLPTTTSSVDEIN